MQGATVGTRHAGGKKVKLELQMGARVRGLAAEGTATVKSVEFHGSNTAEMIFADAKLALHNRIVDREDEPSAEGVGAARPWSFDGDGDNFRPASEARRIQLACLFDPHAAMTSSVSQNAKTLKFQTATFERE
jgi:hypothetical protein